MMQFHLVSFSFNLIFYSFNAQRIFRFDSLLIQPLIISSILMCLVSCDTYTIAKIQTSFSDLIPQANKIYKIQLYDSMMLVFSHDCIQISKRCSMLIFRFLYIFRYVCKYHTFIWDEISRKTHSFSNIQ